MGTFVPARASGVLLIAALTSAGTLIAADNKRSSEIEFNRDIRPIFSDKCFTCHGPDQANRKTKLRFDTEAGAKQDLGGRFAILPGDPDRSELIRRITSDKKALRMPPVSSGRTLSAEEIETLRRWVAQGAGWQKHWSLIPPKRSDPPAVADSSTVRNIIDNFVLARLEREGLSPSPEADKPRLIRRVTLDLTGLPPTIAEIDAFLNDTSPDAYERVVDRLLRSPRYGERMAARWLDAARYADTNGYQTDAERYMWRWRDWVIDAFNANMPFDRFTIEQIAGDLLPNATLSQRIATGFNRNHRGNGEGGIIPEEYAIEYVVDRVETTSTVWLGMTMGCARCHDHKYDPIKQKEFYQFFAYFNNIPEKGKVFKYGNSPPLIKAPTREQQAELDKLDLKIGTAEQRFARLDPELRKAQHKWEKSARRTTGMGWSPPEDLVARFPLDGDPAAQDVNDAKTTASALEGNKAAPQANPEELKPKSGDAKARNSKPGFHDGDAAFAPGRIAQAAVFDGKRFIDGGDLAAFGFYDKFTLAAWIYPTSGTGAVVTRAQDVPEGEGYGIYLKDSKVQVNLVNRWLDDALRVETERALDLNRWQHVLISYDGSRVAAGIHIYLDGAEQQQKVLVDDMNQSFATREPLRIGAGGGPENRFHGLIDDVRVYRAALSPEDAGIVANSESIGDIARIDARRRAADQSNKIRSYFLAEQAPAEGRQAWKELNSLRRERERFADKVPTVMVMQERDTPHDTFMLVRGAYDHPGEKVTRGVPAVLPPLPEGASNNRLGLARWLVDPSNPLTARVVVNRFWQVYFGTGLVKTVEDFGSQGEWPTHPELLDWLATEFIRTGWDVKAIQKLIVMSATYRQSSKVTPELLQKDPENRLLARGPRYRLPAEVVRDQALAISGLLVEKLGGPSVKPYQPPGLWKELAGEDYTPDKGEALYRRSLYTFWKRTIPPPTMMTFDAAGRETCIVRQSRTNTPLQALALMNDVTFVEAARVLAQRMMAEGGSSPKDRIAFGFRLATARLPREAESKVLLNSYHYYLDQFQTKSGDAAKLISEGESPRDEKADAAQLGAYTTVASLILNLDATVTKE
jgi:mono/diheme cytochrome c family protein